MSAMDELDFSGLSDDQLVELAIAIAKEAARRNPALQAAFAEALATEREKIPATAHRQGQQNTARHHWPGSHTPSETGPSARRGHHPGRHLRINGMYCLGPATQDRRIARSCRRSPGTPTGEIDRLQRPATGSPAHP